MTTIHKGTVNLEATGDSYRIRFTRNSDRYCFGTGIKVSPLGEKAALSLAYKVEGDILSGNFDPTLERYKPKRTKVTRLVTSLDLLAEFLAIKKTEVRPHTYTQGYLHHSRWMTEFLADKPDLTQITEKQCRILLASWRSVYKSNTIKDRLKFSALFWDYAELKGDANHWRTLRPTVKGIGKDSEKPLPFTKEERTRILGCLSTDEHFRKYGAFFSFLIMTGCRPSEAFPLTWGDILWKQQKISITKSAVNGITDTTKTGDFRVIPINASIKAILLTQNATVYGGHSALVFPNPNGVLMMTSSIVDKQWRKLLTHLGIPHRKMYACRHTFITEALAQGMLPLQIAKIVGNSPEVIFRHYENLQADLASSMPDL